MIRLLSILLLASGPSSTAAQQRVRHSVDSSGRKLVTPKTDKAINRGLKWLANEQATNGSFGSVGSYRENVGITAIAGIAFLASGSTPDRGPYGREIAAVMDFLLSRARTDGFITSDKASQSHGPMYGHGFATLFLAEIYGTTERDDLRPKLSRAVQLIVTSQNRDGGWRYSPKSRDADMSVTVCQMMALRAARNAGFAVPRDTVDKCVLYLRKCQNDDGGFRYQLESDRESLFPRSAAAIVGFYSAGKYDGTELESGLGYLNRFRPGQGRENRNNYFYGHYYAAQAAWQAGGDHWFKWYPAIRDDLSAKQEPDGSWRDTTPVVGSAYATAMACIVLQMPNNLLPIFQR